MKLFIKLMLALLVLALLLPFTFLKDERGNSLMSFSDFNLPDFKMPNIEMPELPGMPSGKNLVPSVAGSAGSDSTEVDVFYKWHDGAGNVHFTTEPPMDGVDYTIKEFNPDTNVIQAVEIPEPEPAVEKPAMETQAEVSPTNEQPGPYDTNKIKKLFEDTENIEKLLQQRHENQNSALN